jgi:hypothetical protein
METKKIKITDRGDAWIYQHMPVLMALSELLQRWIISILPAAAAFFEYMDNRPGLEALIPAPVRRKIENTKIAKIKGFFGILAKNIEIAKAILVNVDGYIAINEAAEQAYNSVAPPTAPPNDNVSPAPFYGIKIQKIYDPDRRQFYLNQLYNVFDILYLPNYNTSFIDDDRINDDVLTGDIRRKIVSDLVNHATKNPNSYPAIFHEWTLKTEKQTQNFVNFKIRQFYKNIATRNTINEHRTEPAMLNARQAYAAIACGISSLDAIIPTADGGEDTTLYSYIADQTTTSITPEAYLLLSEYVNKHTDDDAVEQQSLFAIDDEPNDDEPLVLVSIKPPRPRTGRAARLKSQQAFDFGGGESDED